MQLGENDLPLLKGMDLRTCIKKDLEELAAVLPDTTIFWSQFLVRQVWHNSSCPAATNTTRKHVDPEVSNKVLALGGIVIHHPGITFSDRALFRADSMHLSDGRNDVWMDEIVRGFKVWLQDLRVLVPRVGLVWRLGFGLL